MSIEDGIKFLVSGGVVSPALIETDGGEGRAAATTER
jgi:uncharacterized membrane protein